MDARVFTLEEVNALVPELNTVMGHQLRRRGEIESLLVHLGRELGDIPDAIALHPSDKVDVREIKRDLIGRIEEYQSGWRRVAKMGAVLKDARAGLVDFYGNVGGKLVWLCWKYGENEVAYYHALEAGFSGRRPIIESVRFLLLN